MSDNSDRCYVCHRVWADHAELVLGEACRGQMRSRQPATRTDVAVCALTESQQADYEERAAILEFDAGNTREDAERLALAMVRDKRTRVPKGQRGEA